MSDVVSLTFTKKELRSLKYILAGVSNTDMLMEQMTDEFKEMLGSITGGSLLRPEDIDNLQEAVNHLCHLDVNPYVLDPVTKNYKTRKSFFEDLLKHDVNLFVELIEFVFLPARKRKIGESSSYYQFDSETREELADVAVEAGLYLPNVIGHYFKLLAKSASWGQKERIKRWLAMPKVKADKKLIMLLAKSLHRSVQVTAIDNSDKSLMGFLVADISDEVAVWYLQKKMNNPKYVIPKSKGYGWGNDWQIKAAYEEETKNKAKRSK